MNQGFECVGKRLDHLDEPHNSLGDLLGIGRRKKLIKGCVDIETEIADIDQNVGECGVRTGEYIPAIGAVTSRVFEVFGSGGHKLRGLFTDKTVFGQLGV